MKPEDQKSSMEKDGKISEKESEKASDKDDISAIVSEVLNKSAKEDDMIVKQVLEEEEEKENQIKQKEEQQEKAKQEEKAKQDQIHDKMIKEEIEIIQDQKESDHSSQRKIPKQVTVEAAEDKADSVGTPDDSNGADQKSEEQSEEKPKRKIAWRVGEVKIGAQRSDSSRENEI